MPKFTTLETHIGDRPHKPYLPGETREVDDPASVKHLTDGDNPILGEFDKDADAKFIKAQKALQNKAEGAADENKSA
jgi:hypothetical protein